MPKNQPPQKILVKENLHPLNQHRNGYDYTALIDASPTLGAFVKMNPYGNYSVDFADPGAVKALNQALLKYHYGISWWDIPEGFLCPPIPGRADYIHTAADLLAAGPDKMIPKGPEIKVLDVGIGANCVYPIIGRHEYGWRFVGSDTDPRALESAGKIIQANPSLAGMVELRLQKNPPAVFKGVIQPDEFFHLTICNPPFHASAEEAGEGTARKLRNLTGKKNPHTVLNFGGGNSELWCEGGEKSFVTRMVRESVAFGGRCLWFTTLLSKKNNLPAAYQALKDNKALEVKTFFLSQGQKISRVVAWTFLAPAERLKFPPKIR